MQEKKTSSVHFPNSKTEFAYRKQRVQRSWQHFLQDTIEEWQILLICFIFFENMAQHL